MASGNAHEEPNLVPLLDLVLQLVMFFMMCTTFRMEEVEQSIRLPTAQSAKPMIEAKSDDILFLNVNSSGQILSVGQPRPLTGDEEVAKFLQAAYADAKRRAADKAHRLGGNANQSDAELLVIIRADRDAEYEAVYRVMRKCQEAGLRKMQLRAQIPTGR
jgi:biopolymer transport protein ExbD